MYEDTARIDSVVASSAKSANIIRSKVCSKFGDNCPSFTFGLLRKCSNRFNKLAF